jgi:hypothetical protein
MDIERVQLPSWQETFLPEVLLSKLMLRRTSAWLPSTPA